MSYARDFAFDGLRGASSQDRLATWYQQGLSDGLGDRLLMFDNSSSPSLELLRFRTDLTASPGFEVALRERVRRLSHFEHEGFARIRTVEYLGDRDGLALITNYTPGKRLSEILRDARGPWLAASLVRQLTPALAALQTQDRGIIHAAVGPDRIIVTPEGRLVIIEHVLGSALQRLELSSDRLAELGIAVPPSPENKSARLDSRTDFFQLGLVALSLLLGRPIGVHEYRSQVGDLLDELTITGGRTGFTLRRWLERALFVKGAGFESAADAEAASSGLPVEPELRQDDRLRALIAPPAASIPVDVAGPPSAVAASRPDLAQLETRPALDLPTTRTDASASTDTQRFGETHWPLIEIIKPTDPPSIDLLLPEPPPDVKAPAAIELATARPPEIPSPRSIEKSIAHVDYLRRPELQVPAAPPSRAREYDSPPPAPPRPVFVPGVPQEVTPPVEPVAPVPAASAPPAPAPPAPAAAAPAPAAPAAPPVASTAPATPAASTAAETTPETQAPTAEPRPDQAPATPAPRVLPTRPRAPAKPAPKRRSIVSQWFTAIVAGCAIGEAIVIGFIVLGRSGAKPPDVRDPGTAAVADSRSTKLPAAPEKGPVAPSQAAAGRAGVPSTTPGDAGTVATAGRQPKDRAARSPDRTAAALSRSTGFTISSPLELQVYEGERLLGSTSDGVISAPPGRREVDLVNTRVGYRARQTVYVRAGTIASIGVALPRGRVSVNAAPWAEVFIDGKSVGETPLGNLSVPIGEHEFVFRHPQLGERRQTATVRADGVTRVTADLQR